jgi:hypothetical protein
MCSTNTNEEITVMAPFQHMKIQPSRPPKKHHAMHGEMKTILAEEPDFSQNITTF